MIKKICLLFLVIFNASFAKEISRIITLSHFSTVLLVQLGQEEKLIGEAWNTGVEFPKEIKEKIKNVPNLSAKIPTKEKVYSLSPDLLVGWGSAFRDINLGPIKELNSAGIQTFAFESSKAGGNIETVFKDFRRIGKILSIEEEVEKDIATIKETINNVDKKKEKETIVVISNIGVTPSAIGGKGLVQSIIDAASSYKNVFEEVEKGYFNTPWETIVNKKMDNILILAKSEKDFINKYRKIEKSEYFKDKKALKNGNVFYLNYLEVSPTLNIGITVQKLNQKKLKKISDFKYD